MALARRQRRWAGSPTEERAGRSIGAPFAGPGGPPPVGRAGSLLFAVSRRRAHARGVRSHGLAASSGTCPAAASWHGGRPRSPARRDHPGESHAAARPGGALLQRSGPGTAAREHAPPLPRAGPRAGGLPTARRHRKRDQQAGVRRGRPRRRAIGGENAGLARQALIRCVQLPKSLLRRAERPRTSERGGDLGSQVAVVWPSRGRVASSVRPSKAEGELLPAARPAPGPLVGVWASRLRGPRPACPAPPSRRAAGARSASPRASSQPLLDNVTAGPAAVQRPCPQRLHFGRHAMKCVRNAPTLRLSPARRRRRTAGAAVAPGAHRTHAGCCHKTHRHTQRSRPGAARHKPRVPSTIT
jgi:hypothetical protein